MPRRRTLVRARRLSGHGRLHDAVSQGVASRINAVACARRRQLCPVTAAALSRPSVLLTQEPVLPSETKNGEGATFG